MDMIELREKLRPFEESVLNDAMRQSSFICNCLKDKSYNKLDKDDTTLLLRYEEIERRFSEDSWHLTNYRNKSYIRCNECGSMYLILTEEELYPSTLNRVKTYSSFDRVDKNIEYLKNEFSNIRSISSITCEDSKVSAKLIYVNKEDMLNFRVDTIRYATLNYDMMFEYELNKKFKKE